MFILVYMLLFRCVTLQQHVISPSNEAHPLEIEPLILDIRLPDVHICQEMNTEDCKSLIHGMLKCQQIIFNDPGFSYQQYKGNINVHRQILAKYQSMCEGTPSDYLVNDLIDFKKA